MPKALRPALTTAFGLVTLTFGVVEQAAAQAPGGAQPALVSIDLKGSNHYRRKSNNGVPLPVTEFKAPSGQQQAQFITSAAKMNSTIDAEIVYYNPSFTPVTSTVVRAEYNGVTCGPTRTITFSPPIAPFSFATVSTQIGPLPNGVNHGTLLILTGTTGVPLNLFLTFDTPQNRMAMPWVGVLDWACRWARFHTTASNINKFLAQNMFDSGRFLYSGVTSNYVRSNLFNSDTFFYLTTLLLTLGNPVEIGGQAYFECRDVAVFLVTLMESLGLSGTPNCYTTYVPDPIQGPTMPFQTSLVCLIGSSRSAIASFGSTPFVFHCIVETNLGVVDACAAQLYDANTGALFQSTPSNWSLQAYWQTGGAPPSNVLGLVSSPVPSNLILILNPNDFAILDFQIY